MKHFARSGCTSLSNSGTDSVSARVHGLVLAQCTSHRLIWSCWSWKTGVIWPGRSNLTIAQKADHRPPTAGAVAGRHGPPAGRHWPLLGTAGQRFSVAAGHRPLAVRRLPGSCQPLDAGWPTADIGRLPACHQKTDSSPRGLWPSLRTSAEQDSIFADLMAVTLHSQLVCRRTLHRLTDCTDRTCARSTVQIEQHQGASD